MSHAHIQPRSHFAARVTAGTRCLAIVIALMGVGLVAPATAAPTWRTTSSKHFTAIGDASDVRLREVLVRLEQFREVLRRVSPSLNLTPALPIVVVVFDSQRSLEPFAPLFDGRPIQLGGAYVGGTTAHFVALDVGRGAAAYPVVFHEFTHLFLRTTLADVPVWFNEGLAGFYETFELAGNNRSATIGRANGPHVNALRERMLPLDELLGVTQASPLYNEGDRRSIFYAQSWALTHYLMVGNPARARQLPAYLQALIDGVDEPTAFATAFGATTSQIEGELTAYVRNVLFTAVKYDLNDSVGELAVAKSVPMSDADATTLLAELQYMVKRKDEARTRLEAALRDAHDHPGLLRTRALFDILDERPENAISALEPLIASPTADAATLEVAARAYLAPRVDLVAPADIDASQIRARDLLTRAVARDPRRATAHEMLARLHLRRDGDPKLAELHARTALSLAPVRSDVLFVIADAQVKQEKFADARATLGGYLARTRDKERRERIRAQMGRIASYEKRLADARAANGALPPQPSPAADDSLPDGASRLVPVFRELKGEEIRVEAALVALECNGLDVTVVADTAEGRLRFPATPLSAIAFITYRADIGGDVACGSLTAPEKVLITWKPAEGAITPTALQGAVVAIEFPPL